MFESDFTELSKLLLTIFFGFADENECLAFIMNECEQKCINTNGR